MSEDYITKEQMKKYGAYINITDDNIKKIITEENRKEQLNNKIRNLKGYYAADILFGIFNGGLMIFNSSLAIHQFSNGYKELDFFGYIFTGAAILTGTFGSLSVYFAKKGKKKISELEKKVEWNGTV